MAKVEFPQKGMPGNDVLSTLRSLKSGDSDYKHGRMFSLIFNAGEDVARVSEEAYYAFIIENGLSPFAFPSLLKMETEVASMMADLLGGDENTVGNMTSGGSESIMVAVKAARDYARAKKPHITQPELLMPLSAHPAFNKAAHYLGLKTVIVPTDKKTLAADVAAMRQAITENTVMMVGSAPSYPHGIIDPLTDLAEIAAKNGIWMHVDACVGGLELPFVEKLGYPIPTFDFRIPGVCSISADIHKYGFTPKGASVILYRNPEFRQYQIFAYADWPGGVYATPNVSGSRPGGPIASSWATLKYLGIEGYMKLHKQSMEATRKLIEGIETIPGLYVLGKPLATVFAIGSDVLNVFALGEKMKEFRWYIDSQHLPPCLHMTISPIHATIVEPFLADLQAAVKEIAKLKPEDITGEAAMYGMIGSMPDRGMAKDFAVQYLNDLYRVH
ncbi:MAG: aspartate aminotransferase family protein [Chloroflexi bacterium]|nr:aspartate aminotransferase family protein [Chloroflexota bacterium]MBM4452872.1 aspartate aminotransferase family protein [Chloroflexota bacterium]MBM4453214.1 aspartate aminotransferase family protein [Chloroflexota bacterium]